MQISNVCFSAMNTSDFLDASAEQETQLLSNQPLLTSNMSSTSIRGSVSTDGLDDYSNSQSATRSNSYLQTLKTANQHVITLFQDSQTVPIFTNQEVCLVLNFLKFVKFPTFLSRANTILLQTPIV